MQIDQKGKGRRMATKDQLYEARYAGYTERLRNIIAEGATLDAQKEIAEMLAMGAEGIYEDLVEGGVPFEPVVLLHPQRQAGC